MKNRCSPGTIGAFAVLIGAVVTWLPMQLMGMIDNGDWHLHWFRLQGFSQSLIEGTWRPYWHADANSGYGAPTFLFYPPLCYYLASVPIFLGFGMSATWSFAYLAILFVAAFGSYRLYRLWSSAGISACAAILFVLSPPVLFNIYQMHMPASALAIALIPWLFYAVLYSGNGAVRRILTIAVASGLLVLAHPMIAFQAAVVMVVLSIYLVVRGKLDTVLQVAAGGVLGLLISAWYWLPIMLFRDLVHWEFLLNPAWRWEHNVLFARPDPPYGAFHEYRGLFDVLALFGLVLGIALYSVIWNCHEKSMALATTVFACVLVCLYIMSPAGTWLADVVPPFGYLMFAWRWLALQWLLVLGLLAVAVQIAPDWFAFSIRKDNRIAPVVQGAALAGMFVMSMAVVGAGPLGDEFGLKSERISQERATQAIGSEIWPTLEMRPKTMGKNWSLDLKQDPMPMVWVRRGDIRVGDIHRAQHWMSFDYEATRPSTIRLRHLNFPSWSAKVGDEKIPIETERESGAMILKVPPGSRNILIKYKGLPWMPDKSG